jgi:hypothetical protein
VYSKPGKKFEVLQYFLRPIERDSMLKKRLEAEAEMWDLWRMGEEEEAVSAEDTDFACRCIKKAQN